MKDGVREALDGVLQAAVTARDVPGVVALVVDGERILYRCAVGVMDSDGVETMRQDALFRVFSMTKPITSLGIMMLQEEGLLSIDDLASDHLPELTERGVLVEVDAQRGTVTTRPASRPVTIKDLLRHTSGFAYGFCSPALHEVEEHTRIPTREHPLVNDPGARWTYGMSTAFLGWIIEAVSGQSLQEFLRARILGPLGMDDTSFELAAEDHHRLVATYQRIDRGLEGQARPTKYQPGIRGDSGLLSTATDYGRFLQLILRGGEVDGVELVGQATIAEMIRDQLEGLTVVEQPTTQPNLMARSFPLGAGADGFGLGFQVSVGERGGGRFPGSLSWAGLQNTHFWIDPTEGIGVVLLMQLLPFYDEGALKLMTNFERTLYDGMAGKLGA